jgi:ATP-dependent DNA helicase RecG
LEDVARRVGKSLRAVERACAKLVLEGRLKFVGPKKAGRWEVLP